MLKKTLNYILNFYKTYLIMISTITILIVMLLLLLNYKREIEDSFQKQIEINLQEIALQNIALLETEINNKLDFLSYISSNISPFFSSHEKVINYISDIPKYYKFKRIGIAYSDGTAYTTNNENINISDRAYFKASMSGTSFISKLLSDKTNNESVNSFSVPIYVKDKIVGVLFATYSLENLHNLLSNRSFNKQAYSCVIKPDGDMVIDSNYKNRKYFITNIFDTLFAAAPSNRDMVLLLQQNIKDRKHGYIKFENKLNKYLYYYPVDINYWYMCIIVPIDATDNIMDMLLTKTLSIMLYIISFFILLFIFILSTQIRSAKKLKKLIFIDKLTGGISFAKFCIDAQHIINKKHKKKIAIISIDIDDFKDLNTLFGRSECDKILKFIWQTLNDRTMYEEIFTRHIADQFYLLAYFETKEELIERISYLNNLILNHTKGYNLQISFGIYENEPIQKRNKTIYDMIDCANLALKNMRKKHISFYMFYDANLEKHLSNILLLEQQLSNALKNNNFQIYYQMQYNPTGKIVSVKSYIQMKNLNGTLQNINNLIYTLEKNMFIKNIDKYMFVNVCSQQKSLLNLGIEPLPMSINISNLHFFNSDFADEYKKILTINKLLPKYIQIEISELNMLKDINLFSSSINKLKNIGFTIVLNNFGLGYSLTAFEKIHIDIIKLADSFIDNIDNIKNKQFIFHIINFAHSLNIKVSANNIKTQRQYEFLKSAECDILQGDYLSKQITEKELKFILIKLQSDEKNKLV